MSIDLNCLRIFIASPPGLGGERRAVRDEIDQYKKAEAMARGVLFLPAGSEASFGGVGPGQRTMEIQESDYFVLLLWDRWGSPRGTESHELSNSGTEEEYRVALQCHLDSDRPMRQLVMMFKAVDQQQLSDPGPQLDRVLEFKKEIERQKHYRADSFDTTRRCRILMRWHLDAWTDEQESGSESAAMTGQVPPPPILPFEGIDDTSKAKAFGQLERPIESLTTEAWGLADEGRLTEAEVEFAETIVGNEHSETLVSYGLFLCRVGRLDQARMLMERAVQVAEEGDEAPAVANASGNLGIVLQLAGDRDGAEKMYRKSLEAAKRLGLSPHVEKVTWLLQNLGGSTSD